MSLSNNILKIAVLSLLIAVTVPQDLWSKKRVVKYFLQANAMGVISIGDFDGKTTVVGSDKEENTELTFVPLLDNHIRNKIFLGSHIDAHSFAFHVGYTPIKTEWENTSDSIVVKETGDMSFLLLGVEYRYNFFWPDPIRFYIGLAYDFERYENPSNSADFRDRNQGTVITGKGFHMSLGSVWMFHKHIGLDLGLNGGVAVFENISTDSSELSTLSEKLIQSNFELLLGLRVQF